MNNYTLNRRRFLTGASALGAASLVGISRSDAAEPAPEVKKIRLIHGATGVCDDGRIVSTQRGVGNG